MDDEETFYRPSIGSTPQSPNSTSQICSPKFAGERARLLFGCYRKGDANDPDTYVAAVTMVLSRYPAEIVKAVTDPYSGLPGRKSESGWTGMPDVADVKDACEAEAMRLERLAKYSKLPRSEFKRLPRPAPQPGDLATIKVLRDTPQYARMVEVIKTAHPRKWKRDEEGHIWVSFDLLDTPMPAKAGFSRITDEQLRAMYPPREAPIEPAAAEPEGVEF